MTGIFHVFLIGNIILTGNDINLYMYEAYLDLPHFVAEASQCSALLLLGHEFLMDYALVSPTLFIFQSSEVSYPGLY